MKKSIPAKDLLNFARRLEYRAQKYRRDSESVQNVLMDACVETAADELLHVAGDIRRFCRGYRLNKRTAAFVRTFVRRGKS